jgi:medium-chain acyl-[acyl-carrier-protein] hydrolase
MSPSPSANVWLPFRRPLAAPRLRLFALPFAGGGASLFRLWPDELTSDVELCAIQLPGRETRFREPGFVRMRELIPHLAHAIEPLLDRPFAVFGHSMGALIALELVRELRRRGNRMPDALMVAGHAAPQLPRRGPALHALSDAEFRAELRRLGGTPAAVLENDELLEVFLPTLRADFALSETYECADEPALDVPVVVFGGTNDPRATREELDAWQSHTSGLFHVEMFDGDHFFITSHRIELLAAVTTVISKTARNVNASPGSNEVAVWQIDLDENLEKMSGLERLLSEEERQRADRFHFNLDRQRYVIGRAALRRLLGSLLRCGPEEVQFRYNSQGKPELVRREGKADWRFNVAHSGGLAVIAISLGREVGVDVEGIRPEVECLELARRYFSTREIAELESTPPADRRRAFFQGWTRKEAYLKAHGTGLSLALDQFSVSLGQTARLLSAEHDPSQLGRWELHSWEPASEFVAALAMEGHGLRIRHGKWTADGLE